MKYKKAGVVLLIGIILLARLWVGLTRFFDPDEFAHMHWGYLMSQGLIPYKDFFYNYSPLFSILFIPLIWIFGESSLTLMAGRVLIFFISLGSFYLIYKIATEMFNKRVGLLAFVIAAVFPFAFDKTLEFRPDNLMLFLFLVGFYILVSEVFFSHVSQGLTLERVRPSRLVLSGILMGLMVAVLLKGVVLVVGALPVLVWKALRISHLRDLGSLSSLRNIGVLGVGMAVGLLPLILLFVHWRVLREAYQFMFPINYQMFHHYAPFTPLVAFWPNFGIYGTYGNLSLEWGFNLVLWAAAVFGFGLLGVKAVRERVVNSKLQIANRLQILNLNFERFLILVFPFVIGLVAIVKLFYLPYQQYFLIFLPVVAIGAANSLGEIGGLGKLGKLGTLGIIESVLLVLSVVSVLEGVYLRSSFKWTASDDYRILDNAMRISKSDDRFYDMAGSYVFRKDGYFECCVAFTDYQNEISYQMPDFITQMKERKNKFIVLERNGRLFAKLTREQLDYIEQNYVPIGNNLMRAK